MIASHVGRETVLHALGREWRVSRWTRGVWAEFMEWARPRVPDPLEVGRRALALFPPETHAEIVRYAIDRGSEYLSVGSPEVQAVLASAEGTVRLLYLLLRPNHPEVTEDLAYDIVSEVGNRELRAAFDRAAGRVPEAAGPNGEAPAAP